MTNRGGDREKTGRECKVKQNEICLKSLMWKSIILQANLKIKINRFLKHKNEKESYVLNIVVTVLYVKCRKNTNILI